MPHVALLIILSSLSLVPCEKTTTPTASSSVPAVDLAGAVISSINRVTEQINQIKSSLSPLNGPVMKSVTISTNLMTAGSPLSLPGSFSETLHVTGMTNQLVQVQDTMQQVKDQLQLLVDVSSTHNVTGIFQRAGPVQRSVESLYKRLWSWSMHLDRMIEALRSMQQQWPHLIQARQQKRNRQSRVQGEGSPPESLIPGLQQVQGFLSLITDQFAAFQKILSDFQAEGTRNINLVSERAALAGVPGKCKKLQDKCKTRSDCCVPQHPRNQVVKAVCGGVPEKDIPENERLCCVFNMLNGCLYDEDCCQTTTPCINANGIGVCEPKDL